MASNIPNKCQVIITRGCNKGKKCYEVHKYCKNSTHIIKPDSELTSIQINDQESRTLNHISNNEFIDHNRNIDPKPSDYLLYNTAINHIISCDKQVANSEKIYSCQQCGKIFTLKSNMYRHLKHRCKVQKDPSIDINTEYDESLYDEDETTVNFDDLEDLSRNTRGGSPLLPNDNRQKPNNKSSTRNSSFTTHSNSRTTSMESNTHNNINQINVNNVNNIVNNENNYIQIVCISQKDDFRKILTERMGESAAVKYILDCAKNNLEGDLKLLEKVYFEGKQKSEYPIRFLDRARGKLEFMDESKEFILDPQGIELTKRICGNLQNGYLTEITRIIEANLDQQKNGEFLDEFDIFNVNNHIYALSDPKYRKKLLNSLSVTYSSH